MNMPTETININIAVDVIKALSCKTLEGCIYMMDDSAWGSRGQGTSVLKTACKPGDLLRWKVCPIDLQENAYIHSVSFGTECLSQSNDGTVPYLNTWEGIVPCLPAGDYHYRLSLQMGKGHNSVMTIDTPSLHVEPYSTVTDQTKNHDSHEQTDNNTDND